MSEEVAQATTPTSSVTLKEGPSNPSSSLSDDSSMHKDRYGLSKDKVYLFCFFLYTKYFWFVVVLKRWT